MTRWGNITRSVPVRPAAVCLLLLLAGCGAPPAFLLATLAIDTVSFASTGKTPAEHALSAIAQQDCAVSRLVSEGDLCVPVIDGDPNSGLQDATVDAYGIDLYAYN